MQTTYINLKIHTHINETCLSPSNILHTKHHRTDYRVLKIMYQRNELLVYRAAI